MGETLERRCAEVHAALHGLGRKRRPADCDHIGGFLVGAAELAEANARHEDSGARPDALSHVLDQVEQCSRQIAALFVDDRRPQRGRNVDLDGRRPSQIDGELA